HRSAEGRVMLDRGVQDGRAPHSRAGCSRGHAAVWRRPTIVTVAEPKRRSRKRTYAYLLRSMRTLRLLVIARAGRLTRIGGRNVLRLAENPAAQALYTRIEHALLA